MSQFELKPWTASTSVNDERWMRLAIELASQAKAQDEVPIGCVLVLDNEPVGQGFNQPISMNDPTAHAEVQAIRQACEKLSTYRMPNSVLYVTLMPCMMCMGALLQARVRRVVVGLGESRFSLASEHLKMIMSAGNHAWGDLDIQVGCLSTECEAQLKDFFLSKRQTRENSLLGLQTLEHLPNVDKAVVAYLGELGFQTGTDIVKTGLGFAADQIDTYADLLKSSNTLKPSEAKHIAMLKSLSHYLRGNPASSWKLFL